MNYLKMFIEDCKYYDPRGIEIKTIVKYVELKGKIILDVGTGIGRLAFPLSKYAKKVIVLDKNKIFNGYFKRHKRENIEFINKKVEDYLKKDEKFDIILLAWPNFNLKFLDIIKKVMNKKNLLIFITCDNNSDFETIMKKIGPISRNYIKKDIGNKKMFMNILSKKFKVIIKKKINTEYIYPNTKIAFRIIKNGLKLWFNIKLNKTNQEKLIELINKHKAGNKIKFGEIIHFYILKIK